MKSCPVGDELFNADSQTDGRTAKRNPEPRFRNYRTLPLISLFVCVTWA